MVSEFSLPLVLVLVFGCSAGVGYLAASVAIPLLKRSHYTLELEVADLQERILRETKARAGRESSKTRQADAELLAAIKDKPAAPSVPWWQDAERLRQLRQ